MLGEKGTTEDEMAGQCHQSNQHEFDTTMEDSGRQEGLVCPGPWGHKESDTTKRLNNNNHQGIYFWGLLGKFKIFKFPSPLTLGITIRCPAFYRRSCIDFTFQHYDFISVSDSLDLACRP